MFFLIFGRIYYQKIVNTNLTQNSTLMIFCVVCHIIQKDWQCNIKEAQTVGLIHYAASYIILH